MPIHAANVRSFTNATSASGLPDNGWELTAAMVGLEGVGVNPANLPAYTGPMVITEATVIEDVAISGVMEISSGAGNVTISRCSFDEQIQCDQRHTFSGSIIIEDCLFDSGARGEDPAIGGFGFQPAISFGNVTTGDVIIRRSVCRGWGCFAFLDRPGLMTHCVGEMFVWWGDPATTGTHNEGFSHRQPSAVQIYACKFDHGPYAGAPNGAQNMSAVIQCQGNQQEAGNMTVENCHMILPSNRLDMIHITADHHEPGFITAGSIHAINNRFHEGSDGAYSLDAGAKGTWTGNSIYDPSNPPTYAGTAVP